MTDIRTAPHPACLLCGAAGQPLYRQLRDYLWGAPGTWTVTRCPNPDCGLAWLDPMPLAEDLPIAYRQFYTHPPESALADRRAASALYLRFRDAYLAGRYGYATPGDTRWLGQLLVLHPGWRAEADFSIYQQAAAGRDGHLLDVGCGDGSALQRLQALGWRHLEGVDPDPESVALARSRGLTVGCGTLEAQGYPADTFDVITMSHVIEHVMEPVAFLRECHRILRPGGSLVLYTPNLESWSNRRFGPTWPGLDPPRHLYLFTRRTLLRALQQSGDWKVESLTTTVRGAGVHMLASRDARRQGRALIGRRTSKRERISAHLYTYACAALIQVRPWMGEELTLVARRAG